MSSPADIEAHTRTVRSGELSFPVFDQGPDFDQRDGRAVLLLHGFPDSRHLWRYQIPELVEAGLRVIAPDLRGFGDAPKPAEIEDYAIPKVVEDVIGLADSLEIGSFGLVGHDWGAVVAWLLAMQHSERVDRLAALSVGCPGTSGTRSFEQLERAWYAMVFRYGEGVEELVRADDWRFFRHLSGGDGDQERYLKDLSRPGALRAALLWYRANFQLDFTGSSEAHLPRVRCPVLGVWSDGDRYLTEDHVKRSHEQVDGPWRYERIRGASHWMMLDRPGELSRLLLEFFS